MTSLTFGRRLALFLAACVAAVTALVGCGSNPLNPPTPSQPTQESSSAPSATIAASPATTGTPSANTPSEPTSREPKGPPATYQPNGKPLVLQPRIGNVADFVQDGDQWWCAPDGRQSDEAGLEVTEFNKTFGIGNSENTITTGQTKSELEVKLAPQNPYYGGIVTHDDDTQVPFVLPLIEGGESGYAPFFSLPTASFGEAESLTLCAKGR